MTLPPVPKDLKCSFDGEPAFILNGKWTTVSQLQQEAYDNMMGYKFEDGRKRVMKDNFTPFKVYLHDTGVFIMHEGAPEVIIDFLPNGFKVQLQKGRTQEAIDEERKSSPDWADHLQKHADRWQVKHNQSPYDQDEYIYTLEK